MTINAALPSVSLLPGMMSNEELFWHWRTGITPYFHSVPLADPRKPPQVPEIHLYNAQSFLFFDTKFSRQKFVRDRNWLRRNDDSDHVGLQLYLNGSNQVDHGDQSFMMAPGDIYAINLGFEIDASCTDAEVLSVILPREAVADYMPSLQDARGVVFRHNTIAGRLLADFMLSMRGILPTSVASDAQILSNSLIGLLRVLLADGNPMSVEAKGGTLTTLQRYIDQKLGDPDLGVDSICAAYRMSRATLYRLFQNQGGVRAYILRRRLMASFKALTSLDQAKRGIFDLALEFGFSSPSHFTTRFREQFGMTPSEVREAAQSHHSKGTTPRLSSHHAGYHDVELMQRWTQELGHSTRTIARVSQPAS